MAEPLILSIPEKVWLKIDSGQLIGTLYIIDGAFEYYKTYREVDGTPPDDNILPDDKQNFTGIRMFQGIINDDLTFFGKKDLYIYCVKKNDIDTDIGTLLYFHDEDRSSKKIDNSKQDQTTAFDDFFFTQAIGVPTTLTAGKIFDPDVPDYNVDVTSIADISIGDSIFIFTGPSGEGRFFRADVLGITVLELELDRPIDFSFEADDVVVSSTNDLNVDGSVTPQIFEIRAGGATSTLEFDITRILLQNLSDTAVDLSTFGDIAGGLTRGVQLRHKLSATEYKNKWNVKKNSDLSLLGYDWNAYAATNPIQGQDGFGWRFSLNGDDKHGVVVRIGANRSLQLIIQDDLTTLDLLEAIGANHEVD